jgi:hypothetical protein
MEDDQYKGYFIPKGTIVIGSTWYGTTQVLRYAFADILL